jgi:hypothetical protein
VITFPRGCAGALIVAGLILCAGPGESAAAAADTTGEVTLTVRTEPSVAGIRFQVDGVIAPTDASGAVRFTQPRNSANHVVTLLDTATARADHRYEFVRWVGQRDPEQAFLPQLTGLSMRSDDDLVAAFSEQRRVALTVTDQDGEPIAPEQVTAAVARSDTGGLFPIAPQGHTWLDSRRVVYRGGVLSREAVSYSWQNVTVGGTNVVDAGRQTFQPAARPDVTVAGQFYDLTVRGYDALLRTGAGTAAVVTTPDGSIRTHNLDTAHQVTLRDLPRGVYSVALEAGGSVVAAREVRLSRDLVVDVAAISTTDMAIVGGAGLTVAVGLLLAGRRSLRRRLTGAVHRRRGTASSP